MLRAARPAAAQPAAEERDRWLMEGIDCLYRMEFDKGEAADYKAIEIDPEHPYAYLGLAGIAWTRYVYETDQSDEKLLPVFDARIQKAIAMSAAWLKKHPNDAEGLMVMGGAYGVSSRLAVIHREWLKAYWHGRKAVQLTRAAVKADPNLYDAYLGIGMYDYYTDVYPRIVGVLAKIVLRGDRQRGIETLKMVADKGRFSRNTAKILLVEIYTEDAFGARDPEKAVALVRELRAKYPDSAMIHSSELVSLYEARRYGETAAGAKRYVELVKQGIYKPVEAAKGNVTLGCALWALGRHQEALEAFEAAAQVKYGGSLSRWAVWALIRTGNLQDILGTRQRALADYKAALAEPDAWGLRRLAKAGISRPYHSPSPGAITMPF